MEEKEALLTEIKNLISDSTKGVVKEEELDKKIGEVNKKLEVLNNKENNHNEINDLKKSVDNLVEQLNKNSLELKALQENGIKGKQENKTLRDLMKDAIMEKQDIFLKEKNDDYGKRMSMKEWFSEKGNQNSPTFVLKDAVDMLQSAINGNYVNYHRLTELDPMRVGIPLTIYPHVLGAMRSKRISKPYMALLVVYTYTDGTGVKTEGSASSKSSFLLKTVNFPAFYIATYFTLSDETMDDLEEVLDEINATAPDKVLDKIDEFVLGTTGDDSTAIAGLFTSTKHTDFDTTTYASFAESATIIDVIAAAKAQVEAAKYKPDAVWMNPLDFAKWGALKNSLEDSLNDRRVAFNALGEPISVCGLLVRKSAYVTADTLAVVDSNQLWIGVRKDMTMEIGNNGTDLVEGQKTAVLKIRVAFGVRDKAGVVYSDAVTANANTISIT